MNDDLGDDPERTITDVTPGEVVPKSSDWLSDKRAVAALVGAAIQQIERRRGAGDRSDSESAPTPKRSTVALPLDVESEVAHTWRSMEQRRRAEEEARRRREEKEREEQFVNEEAVAIAAEAARLRQPAPEYTPKDWRDQQMHGDAAEGEILALRDRIMKLAKPRTFILPEKGMLVCSGKADFVLTLKDGDAPLPILGKDFGYDPERGRWISKQGDTEN